MTHHGRAVGANIVTTARNEELNFVGDTRISDGLDRTASQSGTDRSLQCEALALRISAVRPSEAGDGGRHCLRGAGEESSGDEGNVESHYGKMV